MLYQRSRVQVVRQLLRVRVRRVWTVGLALLIAVAVIGVQPVSANATVAPMMAAATPAATGTAGCLCRCGAG